jgi:hypothetical protein
LGSKSESPVGFERIQKAKPIAIQTPE